MSVCIRHLYDQSLRKTVVTLYRESLLTMEQVAKQLGLGHHTVCAMLKVEIPKEELRRLKALKYSESKIGDKNPQKGKKGSQASNYKGDCQDGHGYLTRVVRGKRYFVHRIVFAEMLGILVEELSTSLDPHHIDGDKMNNSPDNLALTTKVGHVAIHQRYAKSPEEYRLRGLTLAEAIRYLTFK